MGRASPYQITCYWNAAQGENSPMKAATVVLCAGLIFPLLIAAQENVSSAKSDIVAGRLAVTRTIVLPQPEDTLRLPAACDPDGNLYFRVLDEELRSPVTKYSSNGELKAKFDLASSGVPGPGLMATDYFISPDGELFQLAFKSRSEVYVLKYGKDGSFKAKTKLEAEIVPYHIGVFRSGEFLISGVVPRKYVEGQEKPIHDPYHAIFRPDGTVIKLITSKEDGRVGEAVAAADHSVVPDSKGTTPYVGGNIFAGTDGNLYLWRRTSSPTIEAISPSGEIVKSITVHETSLGLFPLSILAHENTIAILFGDNRPNDTWIVIADLSTGEELQRYQIEQNRKFGVLACFTPPSFTFVEPRNGKMVLNEVEPR